MKKETIIGIVGGVTSLIQVGLYVYNSATGGGELSAEELRKVRELLNQSKAED